MQGEAFKKFMQVSDSDQIYISEECSGEENTLVQTIVVTHVRNDSSGEGRRGRFEIYIEVELTELEGEGGLSMIPRFVAYVTG